MTEVAVVLMAYGSPERLDDVPAYYADIRCGRPIRPELLEELVERYRRLGIDQSNPLNAITANLVALKTEFNPGSVQQIETSSRMIARIVSKLANLDLAALQQAEATAGGGVDVEKMGRAGSL